jgi:hypothetical protein
MRAFALIATCNYGVKSFDYSIKVVSFEKILEQAS